MSKTLLLVLMIVGVWGIGWPVVAQSDTTTPVVAWILNGQLWLYNGATVELVTENVLHASLSPDRSMMAYVSSGDTSAPVMTIISTQDQRLIEQLSSTIFSTTSGKYIRFSPPIWIGNTAVVFNTIEVFGGISGAHNRYDIQRLSVVDGSLTELLAAGEGGDMVPSPDDHWLAIRQAGVYGPPNEAGFVQIINAETGEPHSERYTFPAVATASEITWLPSIHWNTTSDTILFAIPYPDAVYMLDEPSLSQLCTLTTEAVTTCSVVELAYPAQLVANADLSQIAYVNQRQTVWGTVGGEMHALEADSMPVVWLINTETLIYQRYAGKIGLYRADTQALWQPTTEPVLNVQLLEDGRWLLATGTYATFTVGIFDPTNAAFETLVRLGGGFPRFAER